jgi:hypothetical protein
MPGLELNAFGASLGHVHHEIGFHLRDDR